MKHSVKYAVFVLCGLLCAACGGAFAADEELIAQQGKPGMRREMTQAIRLYRENRFNDAMDGFLDIMVTGTPSEKAVANDYINRINQRFGGMDDSSGEEIPDEERAEYHGMQAKPSAAADDSKSGKYYTPSDFTEDGRYGSTPNNVDDEALVGNVKQQRRVVMAKRIDRKISEMRRMALLRLNKVRGVQVYMNGERPEAVSIDPDVIFSKGMNFKTGIDNVLEDISTVMYTLGKATFLILPEGIYAGDTKIVDMRRAMAVNSYFSRKGIAAARMSVNLNISSQELPAKFKNIPGIGILFYYDKPINTVITAQSETDNPPQITLGVSDDAIDPVKNDGTIVEFAVQETGAHISFWKFQLLYYDTQRKLHVVQDATGETSAYHQVFWNGREDFFGEPYPPGKYIAVVAAADIVGRERIVRRPITILGKVPSGNQKESLQKAMSAASSGGRKVKRSLSRAKPKRYRVGAKEPAESEELSDDEEAPPAETGAEDSSAAEDEDGLAAKPAAAKPETAASDDEMMSADDSQVKYTIACRPGTAELTANGGTTVRQIADSLSVYPMSKVVLTGLAGASEPDAQVMARSRAQAVADQLTSKYGVDSANVSVKTRVSSESRALVEVRMVSGEN